MKLIVLVVFSVVLSRASCRERPDGRELNNDGRKLSDGSNLPDDFSNGGDQYYWLGFPDGDKDEASTVEPEPFSGGPLVGISSTDEPEHFSGEPLDGVSSTDVDMGVPTIELVPELVRAGFQNHDSSDIDHQLKEDGTIQNERKLRGGSKCKSDIMCSLLGGSCVNNSTYCSGRELPSVCGGPKCKCCITVNLEVRMHDLETELRSMIVNITIANSNLNTKFDSMMNFMISSNSSQATVNSNMDLKIDSIMSTNSNITIANSNMKNELKFMIGNVTNANAIQETKLDTIMEHQGCPEGLFLFAPSNQCFRFLNETKRDWVTAKAACRALGLELSQPYDPLSLRNYLVTKYALTDQTWIDARGDGSSVKWQRNGLTINAYNPLWWPGSPGSCLSTSCCVGLLNHESWWKSHPTTAYHILGCQHKKWTLCELVTE